MKAIVAAMPALCLALAGCQPAGEDQAQPPDEQQQQQDQPGTGSGTTGSPAAGESADAPQAGQGAGMAAEYAEAEILPTEGQDTGGVIKLTREGDQVRIEGSITGLTPGSHGFHIHEKGDCSAPDASSAGGHYEPADDPHGSPQDPPDQHHLGDFGNITANEDGEAEVRITDPEIRLSGPESVIGKAIIVHGGEDDLESQPSGDAGPRVGCGEIRALEVSDSSTTV